VRWYGKRYQRTFVFVRFFQVQWTCFGLVKMIFLETCMSSLSSSQESTLEATDWRRPFFLIWTGQSFSLLGSAVVQFSLVWWLTSTTNSAVVLATSAFVAMLPGIFLAPFAGALVDRWNRKRVMMVADSAIALATIVLVYLFWAGSIQIWHIYVISFLRGLGGAFHWPAMAASTSLMVPSKHFARIQGINQALGAVINIIAPPLGALLIGIWAMHQVLMLDVVTAAIAVSTLALVRIPQPVRADGGLPVTPALVLRDIREGFQYLAGWRGAMMLLGIALLLNFLLTPAFVLAPLMITRIFKGGAWELGAMDSALAAGMVAGGLALGVWGGFKSKMVTSLTGITVMGIGAVIVGLAPANLFLVMIAGIVILGMANPIANGPLNAILQERIAPEMQGRVFSLVSAGANAITPLATLISGPVAELLGLRSWYLVAGVACIVMGIAARFQPDIMSMDHQSEKAPAAD
jgi:DHA3 family macrolide efflux protein-like MFS transporter